MTHVKRILRVLAHPSNELYEMKCAGVWPLLPSALILLLWYGATVLTALNTNFKFNYNHLSEVNVLYLLASTVGLFLLWTLVNWAVTTLLDGKGRMREIFVASSYALIPYVAALLVSIGLSYLLTIDEGAFMTVVRAVGLIYSAFVFLAAMSAIHDYSFGKTVLCVLLSAAGIVFILFLLVLFFGLLQQVTLFVETIYMELQLRG